MKTHCYCVYFSLNCALFNWKTSDFIVGQFRGAKVPAMWIHPWSVLFYEQNLSEQPFPFKKFVVGVGVLEAN